VLLAAILIYFVVTQSQSKISHKENPPSLPSSSQSVSAVPSSSSAPEARPATSRESENSTEHRSRDERLAKVTDENSGSSAASSATPEKDDGEHELAEARRYLDGTGVPKNTAIASTWLWKAVSKQNSEAVLLLSDLYARGDGVPKSCAQAQILLSAEARRGSPAASQKLADINNSVCR
jgi:TPR repeat protein